MLAQDFGPDTKLNDEAVCELFKLGWQLIRCGKLELARQYFTVLCHQRPYTASHWFAMGQVHQHSKNYELAIEAYQRSGALDASNPFPFYHAAECFFSLERADEGLRALNWAEWMVRVHKVRFPFMPMIAFLRETWSNRAAQSSRPTRRK